MSPPSRGARQSPLRPPARVPRRIGRGDRMANCVRTACPFPPGTRSSCAERGCCDRDAGQRGVAVGALRLALGRWPRFRLGVRPRLNRRGEYCGAEWPLGGRGLRVLCSDCRSGLWLTKSSARTTNWGSWTLGSPDSVLREVPVAGGWPQCIRHHAPAFRQRRLRQAGIVGHPSPGGTRSSSSSWPGSSTSGPWRKAGSLGIDAEAVTRAVTWTPERAESACRGRDPDPACSRHTSATAR